MDRRIINKRNALHTFRRNFQKQQYYQSVRWEIIKLQQSHSNGNELLKNNILQLLEIQYMDLSQIHSVCSLIVLNKNVDENTILTLLEIILKVSNQSILEQLLLCLLYISRKTLILTKISKSIIVDKLMIVIIYIHNHNYTLPILNFACSFLFNVMRTTVQLNQHGQLYGIIKKISYELLQKFTIYNNLLVHFFAQCSYYKSIGTPYYVIKGILSINNSSLIQSENWWFSCIQILDNYLNLYHNETEFHHYQLVYEYVHWIQKALEFLEIGHIQIDKANIHIQLVLLILSLLTKAHQFVNIYTHFISDIILSQPLVKLLIVVHNKREKQWKLCSLKAMILFSQLLTHEDMVNMNNNLHNLVIQIFIIINSY